MNVIIDIRNGCTLIIHTADKSHPVLKFDQSLLVVSSLTRGDEVLSYNPPEIALAFPVLQFLFNGSR